MLAGAPARPARSADPAAHVLVVINDNSRDSREVGEYYVAKRKVPAENVCRITCPTGESISASSYDEDVAGKIRAHLASKKIRDRIDYIVLTKGMPLKVTGTKPESTALKGPRSLDSILVCLDFATEPQQGELWVRNPYYKRTDKFTRDQFGIYLVTRLDGYTVDDAKRLVDNALKARADRSTGLFLFDRHPKKNWQTTKKPHDQQKEAADALEERGFRVRLDNSEAFVGGSNLMGYASWGSNDKDFNKKNYESLSFLPGGIAETYVSTGARSFEKKSAGQSQIGDLIRNGCTGVKGYVSEPYTLALADVSILFDRYTRGANLAESFYAASPFIYWKDVVVGDPLCCPYKATP
jgi:uncharacterized protein (TIGR03790 family)